MGVITCRSVISIEEVCSFHPKNQLNQLIKCQNAKISDAHLKCLQVSYQATLPTRSTTVVGYVSTATESSSISNRRKSWREAPLMKLPSCCALRLYTRYLKLLHLVSESSHLFLWGKGETWIFIDASTHSQPHVSGDGFPLWSGAPIKMGYQGPLEHARRGDALGHLHGLIPLWDDM